MLKEFIILLINYNSRNDIADDLFYDKIFSILKSDEHLTKYLNELVLIDKKTLNNPDYSKYTEGFASLFGLAAYDTILNNFVVYIDNLKYQYERVVEELYLEGSDAIIMFNFLIMQTLLHEIEHVKQKYLKNEGDDYESHLLRVTSSNTPETTATYDYNVKERLAEIKSYKQILEMYECMGIDNQVIYDYFENRLKESYLAGYHFRDENGYVVSDESEGLFISPTDLYVERMNCNRDSYEKLAQFAQGDYRLLYGLSISLEKYKEYKGNDTLHL